MMREVSAEGVIQRPYQAGPPGTTSPFSRCTASASRMNALPGLIQMPCRDVTGVSSTSPLESTADFFHPFMQILTTLETSVHVLSGSRSLPGSRVPQQEAIRWPVVEKPSLQHTEGGAAWGESSLCYFMGGRFKRTACSGTFCEAGVAKWSFETRIFLCKTGWKILFREAEPNAVE